MTQIAAKLVKELRDKTGVGMMDAKKALVAVEGDMEKAIDFLREKGMAKAGSKSDRIAAEGLAAVATNGNTAAIVSKLRNRLRCEKRNVPRFSSRISNNRGRTQTC